MALDEQRMRWGSKHRAFNLRLTLEQRDLLERARGRQNANMTPAAFYNLLVGAFVQRSLYGLSEGDAADLQQLAPANTSDGRQTLLKVRNGYAPYIDFVANERKVSPSCIVKTLLLAGSRRLLDGQHAWLFTPAQPSAELLEASRRALPTQIDVQAMTHGAPPPTVVSKRGQRHEHLNFRCRPDEMLPNMQDRMRETLSRFAHANLAQTQPDDLLFLVQEARRWERPAADVPAYTAFLLESQLQQLRRLVRDLDSPMPVWRALVALTLRDHSKKETTHGV